MSASQLKRSDVKPWMPTSQSQRLPELDVLRGFAVLGILVMNIIGFALPLGAYSNPVIAGGSEGLDRLAFYIQDALFDGRMRAMFCLLFGAGLALSIDKATQHGFSAASTIHRRYFWLVVFGILHVFVLQMPGDILFDYGLVALFIWSFAKASIRKLLVASISLLVVVTALKVTGGWLEHRESAAMEALNTRAEAGEKLTKAEQDTLSEWQDYRQKTSIAAEQQGAKERIGEIRSAKTWTDTWLAWQGDMLEAVTVSPQTFHLLAIAGTMLLGVVLLRTGFMVGKWRTRSYLMFVFLALLAALGSHLLSRFWAATGFGDEADLLDALWLLSYEPFRILVAMGWIAALLLAVRRFKISGPLKWLAQTGRMALTVYLLETLIATTLFFGWGFGLFGAFGRFELLWIVLLIQLGVVVFANLWMMRFRQGPVEAFWRRLSYGKKVHLQ